MWNGSPLVEYTTTTLPAGGAETAILQGAIKHVEALKVISAPADTSIRFGNAATTVPYASADVNDVWCDTVKGTSSTGGSIVVLMMGR